MAGRNRGNHGADQRKIREQLDHAQAIYRDDPQGAIALATDALHGSEALDWSHGVAHALLVTSAAKHVLSDYATAIAQANRALQIFDELADTAGRATAYHRLAGLRLELGQHDEAEEAALLALRLRRRAGDGVRIADTLAILARLQHQQAHFSRALEYSLESLETARASSSVRGEAVALTLLGSIYEDLRYTDLAGQYFQDALHTWNQLNDRAGLAGSHYLLGRHALRGGHRRNARTHLTRALDLYEQLNERLGQIRVLVDLAELDGDQITVERSLKRALDLSESIRHPSTQAEVLVAMARLSSASQLEKLAMTSKAIRAGTASKNRKALASALELRAAAYEAVGDHKKANAALRSYLALRLELSAEENSVQLRALETRRQLEAIKTEAEMYRMRAEDLALTVTQKEKHVSLLGLHLAQKQAFLAQLRRYLAGNRTSQEIAKLIGRLEKEVDDETGWQMFEEEFDHLNGGFSKTLAAKFPTLTPTELRICSMLRAGLSSKRIGGMLHTSPSTIDTHRKHIRKKLGLENRANLTAYLTSL